MARGDLVLALRSFSRRPVFTLTAVLTIALGIGAVTAIFSVAHAVLLRPLPYKDPDSLVVLYEDLRARNDMSMPFSNENFVDIREGTRSAFEDMGAVQTLRQVLPTSDGTPEQVRLALVTTNFFRVMGARIERGRDFDETDGLPPPAPPAPADAAAAPPQPPRLPFVVILSHEYWVRRYGGRSDILGHTVNAGPVGLQIVGVLAPGFELLFPPADEVEARPDIWIANRARYDNANRNAYGLRPIGRLKRGVTRARAQEEAERVTDYIRKHFPVYGTARSYTRLEPMHRALVEKVRPAIIALMGAAAFLLLIACANVANLLLVRVSMRQTELAVRSAMGAGWWRLVRHVLSETLVIGVFGTIVGVGVAWAAVRVLLAYAPANLPRLDAVTVDPLVLGFAAAAGVVAAILFGLVPAWTTLRLNVTSILHGSSRTEGLGRGSLLRRSVVVAEVTLCFVLLIGSGLMLRSFIALQKVDPGFDPHGLLTFQVLGGRPGPPPARAARTRALQEKLRALPGVQSVTAAFPLPLTGDFSTIRWGTEAALADNSKYQAVEWQAVLPGYFTTLGTRLVEGRTFTETDDQSRAAVVVVDRILAAKAFLQQSAVGKRILIRIRTPEPEWVEVIGVVEHQRVTSLADPGREQLYVTNGLLNFGAANKWAIRTSREPAALVDAARAAVASLDSQLLVTDVAPMDALVYRAEASMRFTLLLIAAFTVAAVLLVAVGLYGVLSTVVRESTAEIGVRMALGAGPVGIQRLVVGQGLRLSVIGLGLGVVASLAVTRLMTTMLLEVRPTDPLTYASMAALFIVVACSSAWLPARRAASLDPTIALRGE